MTINTRDFGKIEVDEKDIITFVQPLFGFEETKFVMLMDDEVGDSFAWLQSTEVPQICLVLANPSLLSKKYEPALADDCVKIIGGEISEKWLVAVITEDMGKSTVNLKSPVLLNLKNNNAMQAVSEDKLPIRYELFSGKEFDV